MMFTETEMALLWERGLWVMSLLLMMLLLMQGVNAVGDTEDEDVTVETDDSGEGEKHTTYTM